MCNDLPVTPTFLLARNHAASTKSVVISKRSQPSMQSDHTESEDSHQYAGTSPYPLEQSGRPFEQYERGFNLLSQHVIETGHDGARSGKALPSIYATDSDVSTPDSATFSYTHNTSVYPSPPTQWLHSHPYPLDHQSPSPNHAPTSAHRSSHHRANAAASFQHLPPPFPGYNRRRSLSHGDVDRLAPAPANPTFVRLRAPRYHVPDEHKYRRSRIEEVSTSDHGVTPGQHTQRRGRPQKSHMPYMLQGNVQLGGMQLTSIGTPIDALGLEDESGYRTEDLDSHGNRIRQKLPEQSACQPPLVVQRMSRPEDIERSTQIIQIGAMAIRNPRIDPALDHVTTGEDLSHLEHAIKKLIEVVSHLRKDKGDKAHAIAACVAIKDNLLKKLEFGEHRVLGMFGDIETEDMLNEVEAEDMLNEMEADIEDENAPSNVMRDNDDDTFSRSMTGTDLESMLREGFEGVEVDEE